LQTKGKKIYVPYEIQPTDVVTIHRYYTSLKRDNSYKKRVSWFENLPEQYLSRQHVTIVEYSGICPRGSVSHGNAKQTCQEYFRTDPKVIEEIRGRLNQKQSCSDICKDLAFKDLDSAPRDHH
jgi:acyl-CoA hydrolase